MEQHRRSALASWEWSKVATRGLREMVPRWWRDTRGGLGEEIIRSKMEETRVKAAERR
jgi:hypothetical protein